MTEQQHPFDCMCTTCVEMAGGVEAFHAALMERARSSTWRPSDGVVAAANLASGCMLAMEGRYWPRDVPPERTLGFADGEPMMSYPHTYQQGREFRDAVAARGGDVGVFDWPDVAGERGQAGGASFRWGHMQWGPMEVVLWVVDLDEPGRRSVTNAANEVIAWLGQHFEMCGRRVFYRDSMRKWDELVLKPDGTFHTWRGRSSDSLARALEASRACQAH